MKIESAEIRVCRIPMKFTFEISGGVVKDRRFVIAILRDADGRVGYGEYAGFDEPFYSYESRTTAIHILRDYILPKVIGAEFSTPEEFIDSYSWIKGHNFAKSAAEEAFWCLYSQEKNTPIAKLIGGDKDKVEVGISIGMKETMEKTLKTVRDGLDTGYRRIKIKIRPGRDVEVIKAIRDRFGYDFPLTVDANSSYTLEHIDVFKKLDEYKLMLIEQPLAHDDIVDHATLQKEIESPVCLDESILSVEDARKAIELGACRIINIKVGRVGGILSSKKIHDYCVPHGIGLWGGGMLESDIARYYSAAVASLPGYNYPADLGPSMIYYHDTIVNPGLPMEDGLVPVPTLPGIGAEIDAEKLEKYTEEKIPVG